MGHSVDESLFLCPGKAADSENLVQSSEENHPVMHWTASGMSSYPNSFPPSTVAQEEAEVAYLSGGCLHSLDFGRSVGGDRWVLEMGVRFQRPSGHDYKGDVLGLGTDPRDRAVHRCLACPKRDERVPSDWIFR